MEPLYPFRWPPPKEAYTLAQIRDAVLVVGGDFCLFEEMDLFPRATAVRVSSPWLPLYNEDMEVETAVHIETGKTRPRGDGTAVCALSPLARNPWVIRQVPFDTVYLDCQGCNCGLVVEFADWVQGLVPPETDVCMYELPDEMSEALRSRVRWGTGEWVVLPCATLPQ